MGEARPWCTVDCPQGHGRLARPRTALLGRAFHDEWRVAAPAPGRNGGFPAGDVGPPIRTVGKKIVPRVPTVPPFLERGDDPCAEIVPLGRDRPPIVPRLGPRRSWTPERGNGGDAGDDLFPARSKRLPGHEPACRIGCRAPAARTAARRPARPRSVPGRRPPRRGRTGRGWRGRRLGAPGGAESLRTEVRRAVPAVPAVPRSWWGWDGRDGSGVPWDGCRPAAVPFAGGAIPGGSGGGTAGTAGTLFSPSVPNGHAASAPDASRPASGRLHRPGFLCVRLRARRRGNSDRHLWSDAVNQT
jgi:hypothetical protein